MPAATFPNQDAALVDAWGRRNRKLADRECPKCGKAFRPIKQLSKYCSRPCARSKNGGLNRKPEVWWTDVKGYIQGHIWKDGQKVRVKFHRLVMERHLGRPLLASEDVHHIDGDKKNNAIENLEVLSHSAHATLSNRGRTFKRGHRLNLTDAERRARADRMSKYHQARSALSLARGGKT